MSINFLSYPSTPYIGTPYSIASNLGSISARIIPLSFDWSSYNVSTAVPNMVVNVNLVGNRTAPIIDKILSIYIDNTGSPVPIYVQFLDTLYTVQAQPYSGGWYPVFTNSIRMIVAGLGFTTGFIPTTRIFISNTFIPPYTDLELNQSVVLYKGSPVIQRNNILQPGFGPPALGDQTSQARGTLTANTTIQNIFGAGLTGYIYLTGINCYVVGPLNSGGNVEDILLVWNGVDTLFSFSFLATPTQEPFIPLMSLGGMNLRLSAAFNWQLFNTVAITDGIMQANFVFTVNPQ